MLTNRYLIAVGIPVILICCGAFAKKLVRGSSWQQSDFYLGVELSLSAIAAALVYIFDLAKIISIQSENDIILQQKMIATASFLVICFFLLLWILSTHQDWEKRTQNPIGQIIWLMFISNIIGVGLMAAFVLLVKGL